MALWTDLIDPATLTGYARASLADYETSKGTLARWLPNREVPDISVRFVAGSSGLVETAKWRAYDAEPEVGKVQGGKRVIIELPAIGQTIPISEYQQLRSRNATEEQMLVSIRKTTDAVVRSVADEIERLRGIVLNTGKATIDQVNFKNDDDFGRPAGHSVTAAAPWSTSSVSRLADLEAWVDTYIAANGEAPGSMVMSQRVFRALASGDEFATQLLNGGSRPATAQSVRDLVTAAGLPDIFIYDRQVNYGGVTTRVLPNDKLLLLPAPVDPNSPDGTALGATFWGQTLTSTETSWGIAASEQPGIVAGIYRNEKPPVIAEVISDAIALPVLANAALSFSADVL